MSVIVYGMEMPEHCGYCRFRYDGICHALQKTQYSMEDCPLVPVPAHGDLIDREEIFVEFVSKGQESRRYKLGEEWELNGDEIRQVISRLPLVIPASQKTEMV